MASSSSMDWDRFFRETEETGRTMREVASRMEQQVAESRRQRAQAAGDAAEGPVSERPEYPPVRVAAWPLVVRERPPDEETLSLDARFREFQSEMRQFQSETRGALDAIRQDLLTIRRDLAESRNQIRDQIKAEIESMGDSIRLLAEGFDHTKTKLQEVADLIRRYTTAG